MAKRMAKDSVRDSLDFSSGFQVDLMSFVNQDGRLRGELKIVFDGVTRDGGNYVGKFITHCCSEIYHSLCKYCTEHFEKRKSPKTKWKWKQLYDCQLIACTM